MTFMRDLRIIYVCNPYRYTKVCRKENLEVISLGTAN